MKKLTIGQTKALQELQDYYQYAKASNIRKQWYDQYQVNYSYYRGEQWLDPLLKQEMKDIGATEYTFNMIEPLLNQYVSLQIRSSKRVGYEANSDHSKHVEIAAHLKQLAYEIQTQNNHVYFSAQKFTTCLVGGVGWSSLIYEDGKFIYDYVDPREVYWDPDDKSLRLDESEFVCRVRYIAARKLKKMYPDHEKEIKDMVSGHSNNPSDQGLNKSSIGAIWEQTKSTTIEDDHEHDGHWVRGRSVKVVEVYYKKPEKYFETSVLLRSDNQEDTTTEQIFKTFDEDAAKDKSASSKIEEKEGSRIWKGVFIDNILLFHEPIADQVPNQKYLPIVPVVLRRDQGGVPYGVVDNLLSLQKAHNFLQSTTLHNLDARTLIFSDETTDAEKKRDFLKNEMRNKNGVVFVSNPREMQVLDHEKNLLHRMNLIQENYRAFETQSGLYDELKGEETNAISGIAIKQRAVNAMNAQNALVLGYENMLVSEGQLMLDTIKGISSFRYSFNLFEAGKTKTAALDEQVSTLSFEVYPDTAPNFASNAEEEKARFAELLSSPNPNLLLSSPLFLKQLGFRDNIAHDLSDEFLRVSGLMQSAQVAQEQEQQQAELANQQNIG